MCPTVAVQDDVPVPDLPLLPGEPLVDIRDVSAVIAELDDENAREKRIP